MAISRRITARFNKRVRTPRPALVALPDDVPKQTEVRNLPVAEARSDLVTPQAQTYQPKKPVPGPNSRPISLSAHLRDARARAEAILRQHPRDEGSARSTCQTCLFTYPCDAVRIAEDVIAITAALQLGGRSSKSLLELMSELVDLDTPRAPRADRGAGSRELTPHSH
jgi:hypothetical protein